MTHDANSNNTEQGCPIRECVLPADHEGQHENHAGWKFGAADYEVRDGEWVRRG